jgi:hypothetical protein
MIDFLLGIVVLLLGTFVGAVFSFNLFAQKIETQADFILGQADEVYASQKETRRAERAMENAKAELKENRTQLAEIRQAFERSKIRLAEVEGRALMYGNPGAAEEKPASRSASARSATRASAPTPSGECELNAGSAGKDLSKCLGTAR